MTSSYKTILAQLALLVTLLAPTALFAEDAGLLVLRETGTIQAGERESMKALFQMELMRRFGCQLDPGLPAREYGVAVHFEQHR